MFHLLEPEVAGHFGRNSIVNYSIHPPVVNKLHYEMDGWLGDDLLEALSCYIVTEHLREIIERYAKTGYKFDMVEVTASEQFRDLYPDRQIPKFWWLRVTGKAGTDDFGISSDHHLVVSNRVFTAIKENCQLNNCDDRHYAS